jgi:hypothetical protein
MDGAKGIVLVHGRDAEDGHDRIADELLDRAALALEQRSHRGGVALVRHYFALPAAWVAE